MSSTGGPEGELRTRILLLTGGHMTQQGLAASAGKHSHEGSQSNLGPQASYHPSREKAVRGKVCLPWRTGQQGLDGLDDHRRKGHAQQRVHSPCLLYNARCRNLQITI